MSDFDRPACEGHRNPDWWFAETGYSRQEREWANQLTVAAMELCAICPIQEACLREGLKPENREHGVWGGALVNERLEVFGCGNLDKGREKRLRESVEHYLPKPDIISLLALA